MKYAGIDIGTTTISAVLIDGSGRELCHYTVPNDSALHGENSWERLQDAERITEICQDLINRIRRDAGTFNGHSALAGIGLTGQMHGIVYFDQNGRAVSPLITWQDGRGDAWLSGTEDSHRGDAAFCGNAYGGGDADTACGRIRKLTGWKTATGFGLVTVYADGLSGKIPDRAAGIGTIEDYVAMHLTGRTRALLHPSNAASLGFYHHDSGFDRESLKTLGIPKQLIPEIAKMECGVGSMRCGEEEIPVSIPIGDNQASFLGSVGAEEDVLINIGTGSQMSALSDRYLSIAGLECRPFVGGRYLINGSSLCGGYAYSILERFYRSVFRMAGIEAPDHLMQLMDRAAEGLPKGTRVKFDTRFRGTREDSRLTAAVTNIHEETMTAGDLSYACMEGIARELYDFYTLLPDGFHSDKPMAASGNGPRNSRIECRIIEKVFGREIRITSSAEEAAYGAALFSLHTAGGRTLEEVRRLIRYTDRVSG